MGLADELADLPLVDQHCHSVLLDPLDRPDFERLLTESPWPPAEGTTAFDSHVGLAVRRWCAPVLGLEPHAAPDDYLARRVELGPEETARRLLGGCGASDLLVDTGLQHPALCDLAELAGLSGSRVHEVTRIETVVEEVAASGVGAADLGAAVTDALADRATRSVGFKTVAAYRVGLDLPAEPPTGAEVRRAADRWLAPAADRRAGTGSTTRSSSRTRCTPRCGPGCRCRCTPATATPT